MWNDNFAWMRLLNKRRAARYRARQLRRGRQVSKVILGWRF